MKNYISILRGINVSGQKKIIMKDLKVLYEKTGFEDVVTYIQSGNVLFNAAKSLSEIEIIKLIEEAILDIYQFHVPVILRTVEDLERVVGENPFLTEEADIERLYVSFLAEKPSENALENLKKYDFPPEKYMVKGRTVYISCPNGYGNTKLSNNFFESKLKVLATTRNWKTTNKLIEISKTSFQ